MSARTRTYLCEVDRESGRGFDVLVEATETYSAQVLANRYVTGHRFGPGSFAVVAKTSADQVVRAVRSAGLLVDRAVVEVDRVASGRGRAVRVNGPVVGHLVRENTGGPLAFRPATR